MVYLALLMQKLITIDKEVVIMCNNKYMYRSSKIVLFAFKYFIPFQVFIIFCAANGFEFNMIFIYGSTIYFFMMTLNLLLFNDIAIINEKIIVSRLFAKREYRLKDIESIHQSIFFMPKIIIIKFANETLIKRYVAFFPLPKSNDFMLMKKEEIISYIESRMKNAH